MKHRVSILSFLLVIALLVGANVASQTPSQSPDKPLYHPTGSEATIVGTISVKGPIPKPRRFDMFADPVCIKLNDNPETEDFVTTADKLANAFVYVKGDLLAVYRFPLPDSAATLERKDCRFSPHVMGLRVGQTLSIVNVDPTTHNTHPTPKLNREWNHSQSPQGDPIIKTFTREEVLIPFKCNQPIEKTFARSEVLIPVKCNQHPWEKGYVAVLNHPFFAVSDGFGNYEIRGVPPGTYTLAVWHEILGWQEVEVSVMPSEVRKADFSFDSAKKP